ncbi:hypothetical protein H9P43_005393 [Blastocladiella emersonii ATCC 22665]|nr:hypothetical protein H9P43_005393 [Blastocladiella emersonii ATCC 22665]
MQPNAIIDPTKDPLVQWGAYLVPESFAHMLNGYHTQIDALTKERDELRRQCHAQQQALDEQTKINASMQSQRDYYYACYTAMLPKSAPSLQTQGAAGQVVTYPAELENRVRNGKHKQIEQEITVSSEHWIRGSVHDPRLYDEDEWESLITKGTEAVVEDILETFGTVFDMDGVHWTANLIEIKVAKLLRRILEDERKRIEYGLPAKGSPLTQPAPEDLIRELEEEFGYRY